MRIVLYNTLTRELVPFEPLVPGKVGLYVCGVTVYDRCHVGHARAFVVFDVLVRLLRAAGYEVRFVRNITDVDDRIIHRAQEEGVPAMVVAERNVREFQEDVAALGCVAPDHEPRATEFIPEMLELVDRLEERGLAYPVDGDVYYAVTKFDEYGKLSRRKLEEMIAGARVEVDERKRHPMDFALWKAVPKDREDAGEPAWASRFGRGRPGWHLECSAMSTRLLGQPFDIHGGGEDLIFPHHENEIAQSEGASGTPLARWFVHNSFVRWRAEKMSKSIGNVFSIREIIGRRPAEALRLFLLSTHYRSPMDFSLEGLEDSYRALVRLYETLARVSPESAATSSDGFLEVSDLAPVRDAMADDLNTAKAIGTLFEAVRELNRLADAGKVEAARSLRDALVPGLAVLGVGAAAPREFLSRERRRALEEAGLDDLEVERRIDERRAARDGRDWNRADEIRHHLMERGVALEDGPEGTTWRPVSWGVEPRGKRAMG